MILKLLGVLVMDKDEVEYRELVNHFVKCYENKHLRLNTHKKDKRDDSGF